ncbi:MAG: hypothetical protein IKR75_02135 [Fibrobacter sp.]|nr:hypothetical protein [Fibrobacter sp.]MBR6317206.1 hypothetical protein [Fibrobacter sp.]
MPTNYGRQHRAETMYARIYPYRSKVTGEAFGMKVGGMRFCNECYQRLIGNARKTE